MPAAARRPLTPRQRECWRLLWRGYTTAGIAAEMGVKLVTARYFAYLVVRNLGVATREEAAALYEREETAAALDDDDATAYQLLARSLTVVEDALCEVRSRLDALDAVLAYPRRYVRERNRDLMDDDA